MSDSVIRVSDSVRKTVSHEILNSIERLIEEATSAARPLEVDPYRSRLFEFFVTADGAGLIGDERQTPLNQHIDPDDETNLSADGLCRSLSRRWGLDMAARESAASQTRLPPQQVEQMRLLWSVMRMWMEWNYAWCRWHEFHSVDQDSKI